MFSRFFIFRPIFASVLSIVITLAGGIAVWFLPVAQYPEIAPPTVQVSASYPGADSKVVANLIAAPIEQQVNGVEGMMYMSSQSTNDGNYTLTVTFKLGVDLDMAQVLVQNRVAMALPVLPDLVNRNGVSVKKKSPNVLMIVNLYSKNGSRDNLYLSNNATIQLRDELARLPGVGDITYLGRRDYSMRLWLDPEKMATRNLTASDVVAAVSQQNLQVAAGQIGQPPVPQGQVFQYTMTTLGRLVDADQFADIILKTDDTGRLVRLRDVARIEMGAEAYDQTCTLDGEPSVALSIYQLPGSNALKTATVVREKMEELKTHFPEGARLQDRLRHHALHQRIDQRGFQDPPRRRDPGGAGGAAVPAELAVGRDPADRRAGGGDRHLRRHGRHGLQPQQPHAVRPGAGHRHRRRRRHRGGGGRRTSHRARTDARARPRSRPCRRFPAR